MRCTVVWVAKQLGLMFVELLLILPVALAIYDTLLGRPPMQIGEIAFIVVPFVVGSVFVVAISMEVTVRWVVDMVKEMK